MAEFSHSLLHQRLLAGDDPTAVSDCIAAHLEPLTAWLLDRNPILDPHLCEEASEEALLALVKEPAKYQSDLLELDSYLRLAASRDLLNLLRRERKHYRQRIPLESVELSPQAGKYLGTDDDPALPLLLQEASRALREAVPEAVWQGLSEVETRVLELILLGERATEVFAPVCGVADLPAAEQAAEVKCVKDRVKQRVKRGQDKR